MSLIPRPPAFSPGFQSFLWGVILGGYVWIGLLAIGTSAGSAFLFGLVAGVLVFFFVRLRGEDRLRRD
jgi:membrane associated rhomboid family serine protease